MGEGFGRGMGLEGSALPRPEGGRMPSNHGNAARGRRGAGEAKGDVWRGFELRAGSVEVGAERGRGGEKGEKNVVTTVASADDNSMGARPDERRA